MIKLLVDNKEIETKAGTTLLQACLDNGIYIPNLCFLEGMENPPASCGMCFVEIKGKKRPVTSCSIEATNGMVVKTDTTAVRRLQRTAFELLLSVHHVDCRPCPANKKCDLQRIAKFIKIGLKPKRLDHYLKDTEIEQVHPFLDYYPNRCILCGKCIYTCRKAHGRALMAFVQRGFDTIISFYGEDDKSLLYCKSCIACVEICPVGALVIRHNTILTRTSRPLAR
ncbi:MAG: 2Fe-2S iron-sulfur cluster-binding protein [Desulfobacterales bacterium]